MWRLYEHQRFPKRLADKVPWFAVLADAPCVLGHKDGSLQHSLWVQPLDLAAGTAHELRAHAARLNNVFKRFGTGWAVFMEYVKRRVQHYPEVRWPHAVCTAVDAERRRYFLDTPHYRLDNVLTLVWRPPALQESRVGRWAMSGHPPGTAQQATIQTFQDQVQRFTDLLAGCSAWVEPLGPERTLTYLHSTVSTTAHTVAVPDVPAWLDYYLTDRDFLPGSQPALLIAPQHAWHLRTLTVSGWPNATYPEMLSSLTALPLEYRFMARWLPLDQADAYTLMRHKLNLWSQARLNLTQHIAKYYQQSGEPPRPDRAAETKTAAIEAAMEESASGTVSFGYYTATVTVWDTDAEIAEGKRREVDKHITGRGFSCHPEHFNATDAWLSSLPGQCYANVRQPLLNSLNMVHGMLGGVYTGPEQDDTFGAPPLMIAETTGHLPYHIVLHEQGVGHTLVIGPSGSGKTTLVGLLALQFQRYHALGARVRLIDKKGGLAPVTRAMGGGQYTLGGEEGSVAFQPFRSIDDLLERQWAASWVEGLCRLQQVPCMPAQRREVWEALTSLATLAPPQRTLTGLAHLVQDQVLRQALHPYTLAGAYGRVLDAVAEPLDLHAWSCFETDTLFSIPPLVAPVLGVLFHQLGQGFLTKAPTFFVLDEAWRYLADLTFQTQIEEWMRELRKLHVSIIFSTQDLHELLASPIATVLLNNCPIRFLLPNKRATEERSAAAYRQIGLNDRQLELLSTARPQQEYMVLTREGCRIVDLAVGEIQKSVLTQGTVP